MTRKRGRIILVGVIGLKLNRAEFYEKELTFQVSCSYGPGRYDENYEQKGIDYPEAFVRWTEKRNFEAVLQAISNGSLKVKELISKTVELSNYQAIYGNMGQDGFIASIIQYPHQNGQKLNGSKHTVQVKSHSFEGQQGVIGIIGAGNFTKMTVLPALSDSKAGLKIIASSGGVSGTALAKKYGFTHSTTDYKSILEDSEVDTVLVTTRHNTHAKLVIEALQAGKHVFVEKPLAINNEQLTAILDTYHNISQSSKNYSLTVGFNRRFSPHTQAIKSALGSQPGPMNIVATMNAGHIPYNVWVHDMEVGGGRIIGEACHYIDLCTYLTGSVIKSVCMNSMGVENKLDTDNASILLKFENGSQAVINYFANGAKSYSKERVEVYSQERCFILDNFRTTKAFGVKGFKNLKTRIDKGHKEQFHSYIDRIKTGGAPLIPFEEIVNVTKASFAALESMKEKCWVELN